MRSQPALHLQLIGIPWPISILKCKQRIDQMQPGDHVIITIEDLETHKNIQMLLNSMPDLKFVSNDSNGHYSIHVHKLMLKKLPAH